MRPARYGVGGITSDIQGHIKTLGSEVHLRAGANGGETAATYGIEPKLFAPMFALQSPEIACERLRIHAPNGDARGSLPSDLARVVEAWPMLPDALKAAVLAIVTSASGSPH